MQPTSIAFAVAVVAIPLSLVPPSYRPIANAVFTPVADATPATTKDGRPLVDAPVSALSPPPGGSPAESVAEPGTHSAAAGPSNATPFSSTPSGTLGEGGTDTTQGSRAAPASEPGVVPELGR